jgi:hypothetical protein
VTTGPGQKEVVLDWAPVAGTTSYVVEVDTDGEWSDDPTLSLTTVATRITLPTSLPHASYVWRVAAVTAGGQSRWSKNGTFTRGWTQLARPLSPIGTPSPAPGIVTFSWSPVPTASEYQLQVSTSRFFDAPFRTQAGVKTESCFTTRTSITPFNSQADARNDGAGDCVFSLLRTGEPRYWRVRPLDHVVDDAPEVNTTPVVDEGISSLPPARPASSTPGACPEAVKASRALASPSTAPSHRVAAASPSDRRNAGARDPVGRSRRRAAASPRTPSRRAPGPPGAFTTPRRGPARRRPTRAWSAPDGPMPTPTLSQDVCVG